MIDKVQKNAREFSKALRWLADQAEEIHELVIRKSVIDLYTNIAERTPADTGRARAGWHLGFENDGAEPGPDFDDSGSPQETRGLREIVPRAAEFAEPTGLKDDIILIYNNVEYIEPLENGHSTQAPQGMVAVSLSEFTSHIRKEAKRAGMR